MIRASTARALLAVVILSLGFAGAIAAEQRKVELIERMSSVPQPFRMIDWKARARGFDWLAFNPDAKGEHLPQVKLIDNTVNIAPPGFKMPSYVGGEAHGEAIACLAAVMSGSLVGINKSDQHGRNWVRMCQEWFNAKNGQRVVLNRTATSTGGSFWYEVFPGVLFCQLAERYSDVEGMDRAMKSTADRWAEACEQLASKNGRADFNWTAFNLATMQPVFNGRWREPDAAAGIAWIEFMAWRKWRDPRNLRAADVCMEFLQRRAVEEGSPLYEVLLYYAPLLAARMNAELGRRYDVDKLVDWCFSENQQKGVPRHGWGIIADRFGEFDCHGLQGSTLDSKGYAFAMNTFSAAAAVAPLARYDTRYARAIGKWLLNVANNARLFYPDALPTEHQSSSGWKTDPVNVVAYEGLRRFAVVPPRLVREATVYGRVEQGGYRDGIRERKPLVFVSDDQGRLEHVWQFEMPRNATLAPFWTRVGSDAPAETFALEGSYSANGPWRTLLKFPRRGSKEGDVIGMGAVMPEPRGHDRVWLRLRNLSVAPAGASLRMEQLHWRIQLDRSPFATGDPLLNKWGAKTDLGVYGSAHVGYLAALVEQTNQEHILQLDLLATDFFRDRAYPTYLYYNPDRAPKSVRIKVGDNAKDLYDAVAGEFVARNVRGSVEFVVSADNARIIVVAPADGRLSRDGTRTLIDGVIVGFGHD
ncbi:MAG: hypothetical protein HZC54_11775 [Verrucomicrobia bacterium]|nr:hypothetical protein [Verrucomicrobiota bacterium]